MKRIDFSEFDYFEKIGGGILVAIAVVSAILRCFSTAYLPQL